MAVSTAQARNQGLKFRNDIIREYVRGNMFSPYMGEDATAIVRTFHEEGKFGGDQINVPLLRALKSAGKGSGTLSGNEEAIDNYGWRVWLDWARNAVVARKNEIKKGSFDLMAQAKPLLSEWGRSLQRDEMVQGLMSIPSESPPAGLGSDDGQRVNGILYGVATGAEKDAWHDANQDRILYGAALGNTVAGSHAASLANVDATNDRLGARTLRLLKYRAEQAGPKIEPTMTDDGYERYVLFVGSIAFADAEADPDIMAANRDARPREGTSYKQNPIFMDGDLLYNGVIIRKVPEIDRLLSLAGAGNGGIDVAPVFLCGRNAAALLWGQLPEPTMLDETDYQFKKGAGIEMAYGIGKMAFKEPDTGRLKDWGVVTGFVASVRPA